MNYHKDSWRLSVEYIHLSPRRNEFHGHSSFFPHTNYFLLFDICNIARIDPERKRHMTLGLCTVCRELSTNQKKMNIRGFMQCNKLTHIKLLTYHPDTAHICFDTEITTRLLVNTTNACGKPSMPENI